MTPSFFFPVSIIVGVAQTANAVSLQRRGGELNRGNAIFAAAECIWAFLSYYAWRIGDDTFPVWLMAAFIAYVAAIMIGYGMLILLENCANPPVPRHLLTAAGIFGSFFATANALYAAMAWLK